MILPKQPSDSTSASSQPSDSTSVSSIVDSLVTNLLGNPGLKCSSGTQTLAAGSPDHNTTIPHAERETSPTNSLHSPKSSTPTTSTSFVNTDEFLSAEERMRSANVTPKSSIYVNMVPLSRSTPTRSSPNSALPFQTTLPFTRNEPASGLTQRGNDETSPPKKQKLEWASSCLSESLFLFLFFFPPQTRFLIQVWTTTNLVVEYQASG